MARATDVAMQLQDAAGVDYRGCTEKKDLLAKLEHARRNARPGRASGAASPPRTPSSPRRAARSGGGTGSGHANVGSLTELIDKINGEENYFTILGVARDASDSEIKKAYRKLALKLHPDKCREPGAEDAYKKVGAAYHCLSDPDKRAHYERFGSERQQGGAGGFQGQEAEELFRQFFGGGFGGPGGGGGGVRFHFGGPGFMFQNMANMRGDRAAGAGGEAQAAGNGQMLRMLPLLFMFLPTLLPTIFRFLTGGGLVFLPVLFSLPAHLRKPAAILMFVFFLLAG